MTTRPLFAMMILTLALASSAAAQSAGAQAPAAKAGKHSVWTGVLIGAAAGGAVGFAVGRRLDSPVCPRPGVECGQGAVVGTATGALWGAGGGWLASVLIRRGKP
jgi:hypothetical protein